MDIKKIDLNEIYELGVATPVKMLLHDQDGEMTKFNEKLPAMIVVPGGGYAVVSGREADPIATEYYIRHYNAFVLNYAIAPYRYPTALTQLACLVDFVKKNADELHIDKNKIFVVGFSAGGHLTADLAVECDNLPVPVVGGVKLDARPSAVVLSYPVITPNSHKGSFMNLLGIESVDCKEAEELSLEKRVTEAHPPCFIWATATDGVVDPMATLVYAMALQKNKVPYECHMYPVGPHGLATCDERTYLEVKDGFSKAKTWFDFSDSFLRSL